jgi:hypothetical protein
MVAKWGLVLIEEVLKRGGYDGRTTISFSEQNDKYGVAI